MQRPKSWLVLGILQICFGGWGILSGLMALLIKPMMEFLARMPGPDKDPAMKQQLAQLDAQTGLLFNQAIGHGLLGVLQIVAGILLIRFVRQARVTNFVYVALNIPFVVIFSYLGYRFQVTSFADHPNQPGAEFGQTIALVSMVVSIVLVLAYQTVLVILLRRDPFNAAAMDQDPTAGVNLDPGNPYQPPRG